jgi:hypothetical protein
MTRGRRDAIRTWVEVCEGYVKDHEREAQRGWDALALLRAAVRHAIQAVTRDDVQLHRPEAAVN